MNCLSCDTKSIINGETIKITNHRIPIDRRRRKKRRKTKKKRSLICHDMIQYEKVFSATFGLGKKGEEGKRRERERLTKDVHEPPPISISSPSSTARQYRRVLLLVSAETSTCAEVVLRVHARARRLLDFWGDGVDTARAESVSQATTSG